MLQEILINVTAHETRIATVENDMVQEVAIERSSSQGISGNIYLGVVVRVLPGMQAAFVDIGLERSGFLHARDLLPRRHQQIQLQQNDPDTDISSLIAEGERILVQVARSPIGSKGARLTGQISIPTRNLVFLPHGNYIGISQRIDDKARRTQLLEWLKTQLSVVGASAGYILRTAGKNVTAPELRSDIAALDQIWKGIAARQKTAVAPALVQPALPLTLGKVRDLEWDIVRRLRVDSRETTKQIAELLNPIIPGVLDKISYYPGEPPIFDLYGVEDQIREALKPKVKMGSGGQLIIDQAEAMTTIDINTGSYVGTENLEETIFKTNLEAAGVLARQVRLRNVSGIIVVDFIDMALKEHRDQVMRVLRKALERDSNNAQANDMTSLGLVEITRKRTGESLKQLLMEPCPACSGMGVQKSPHTTCYEIFREVLQCAKTFDASQYRIIASQAVVDLLRENESTAVASLEGSIGHDIKLQVDSEFNQDQYRVLPLK